VFENLYFNKDKSELYDFAFQPYLVSICLKANNLSDENSKKERLTFNEKKIIMNYVDLIKTIYWDVFNTRILLLNSPMVSGDGNITLVCSSKKIIYAFENDIEHKAIAQFEFATIKANGFGSHPIIAIEKIMANQLIVFFRNLLSDK
jgi:hypothetical protein